MSLAKYDKKNIVIVFDIMTFRNLSEFMITRVLYGEILLNDDIKETTDYRCRASAVTPYIRYNSFARFVFSLTSSSILSVFNRSAVSRYAIICTSFAISLSSTELRRAKVLLKCDVESVYKNVYHIHLIDVYSNIFFR